MHLAGLQVTRYSPIAGQDFMSTAEATTNDSIIFTSAAANKVASLIQEEGNPDLMLRIYIQGGGCSGFQYGFSFDENETDGDTKVVTDGVTLLIDPMSMQYLVGAEVDYTEGLQGSQFVIRNPNATTTCGCGSSFSV
jgi:iron-sulfur cluster insertion protein